MVSGMKQLKERYWCGSCKRKPSSVKKAIALMENMKLNRAFGTELAFMPAVRGIHSCNLLF